MRLLSEDSYRRLLAKNEALEAEVAQLKESRRELIHRHRGLERQYQTLLLRIGMKGFTVEVIPEVPAKAATIALRKITG